MAGSIVTLSEVDDVINLGHYAFALKRAIRDEHASEKKWSSGHINLVKKAWQYAVCRREGGEPGAKSFTKSPAGNTAVPGNTALQRLETSDDPADEGDPRQLLSFWIDDEEAILFAYRNEDLIDMVEEYGYSTKLYENAVRNLIKEILDAGGLHLFDFNELSQADIEDLFKSQIPEAEGLEIGIGMWTYEDCSIWGYDRHKNGVLVSDAYGNSSDTGRASVIDGFTRLYNGNVRAGTAQYGMSWTHGNTHQKQCLKRGDFKDLTLEKLKNLRSKRTKMRWPPSTSCRSFGVVNNFKQGLSMVVIAFCFSLGI